MPSDRTDDPALSGLYRRTRERIMTLVSGLDRREQDLAVPACPGWSVRDIVAHLTAATEDVLAGRLTGPPPDEFTAEQVERFRQVELSATMSRWDELAPEFETLIDRFEVWPAVLDAATHEQDIRGAVGRPGGRHSDVVRLGAERLITWLDPPVALRVVVEDVEFRVGPDAGDELVLTTGWFDALRWRMGRRSRAQLLAMEWSADPSPVVDSLVVFGPSPVDIHE